jgi:hypothetical protein
MGRFRLQADIMQDSSEGQLLTHSSGHEIQTEEPDKVVEAINIILGWLVEE